MKSIIEQVSCKAWYSRDIPVLPNIIEKDIW